MTMKLTSLQCIQKNELLPYKVIFFTHWNTSLLAGLCSPIRLEQKPERSWSWTVFHTSQSGPNVAKHGQTWHVLRAKWPQLRPTPAWCTTLCVGEQSSLGAIISPALRWAGNLNTKLLFFFPPPSFFVFCPNSAVSISPPELHSVLISPSFFWSHFDDKLWSHWDSFHLNSIQDLVQTNATNYNRNESGGGFLSAPLSTPALQFSLPAVMSCSETELFTTAAAPLRKSSAVSDRQKTVKLMKMHICQNQYISVDWECWINCVTEVVLLYFIQSCRPADWRIHLKTAILFCKE